MSEFTTRCHIVPIGSQGFPVEADPARIAFTWPDDTIAARLAHGLDVAPGVRIAVLSIGDHWSPGEGKTISGALVAVRTRELGAWARQEAARRGVSLSAIITEALPNLCALSDTPRDTPETKENDR